MGEKAKLLSGGNPQIPKADGDAPVQAWIGAAPGWKSEAAAALDQLIGNTVPGVRKAVKWNSPFYGAPDQDGTWFLSMHCVTRYLKVAFFNGSSLDPMPPVESRKPHTRYVHLFEGDDPASDEMARWVAQAAKAEGTRLR